MVYCPLCNPDKKDDYNTRLEEVYFNDGYDGVTFIPDFMGCRKCNRIYKVTVEPA